MLTPVEREYISQLEGQRLQYFFLALCMNMGINHHAYSSFIIKELLLEGEEVVRKTIGDMETIFNGSQETQSQLKSTLSG